MSEEEHIKHNRVVVSKLTSIGYKCVKYVTILNSGRMIFEKGENYIVYNTRTTHLKHTIGRNLEKIKGLFGKKTIPYLDNIKT